MSLSDYQRHSQQMLEYNSTEHRSTHNMIIAPDHLIHLYGGTLSTEEEDSSLTFSLTHRASNESINRRESNYGEDQGSNFGEDENN